MTAEPDKLVPVPNIPDTFYYSVESSVLRYFSLRGANNAVVDVDFNNLYYLSCAGIRGALHLCPRDESACTFSGSLGLLKAETVPEKAVILDYSMGGRPRDLIGTEVIFVQAVSERFISVLRDNEFTGWQTYPVEIHGKNDALIEGYHGLAVSGRCGPIIDEKSELRWMPPPCEGGRASRRWFGLYFDPQTWDRTDLFIPGENCAYVFVTERVRGALKKAKVSNIDFEPLTEAWNPRTWQ